MPAAHSVGNIYSQPLPNNGHQLRGRGTVNYLPPRQSTGGILPTPEPTVGSVISDEDVALQLMRLGDVSNFSHGRTSTSTADDALSGKAEAASSDEDTDDEEIPTLPASRHRSKSARDSAPPKKKQRVVEKEVHSDSVESSGDEYNDESFKGESDEMVHEQDGGAADERRSSKTKGPSKSRASESSMSISGSVKSGKSRAPSHVHNKVKTGNKVPMSPASLPPQSRKTSLASTATFQPPLGPDEEDLSSKPRCQRCRKSKKGCDRQRPCGRCKDAGIGIEGCQSEDEGNGRRGRYGRHMGVTVNKKDEAEFSVGDASPPYSAYSATGTPSNGQFLAPALPAGQNKKRKR